MDLPYRSTLRDESQFKPPAQIGAADAHPAYAAKPNKVNDVFVVTVDKRDKPVLALLNGQGEVIQPLLTFFSEDGALNRVNTSVYEDAEGKIHVKFTGHVILA